MKSLAVQVFHALLLVCAIVLIGGAFEYYRPFSQLIASFNIPFKPVYALWAGIIGTACLFINQRETPPLGS